ncbi:hypothetical protein ACQ4PT_005005 [Festuca glaucescens]
MASGSTSSGSAPLQRGLISCLHSLTCRGDDVPTDGDDALLLPDQDLPQAICKMIVRFYEKAFDRLPCETMPELVGLLTGVTSGCLCLGLLDPVSNIILNTLALLPEDDDAAAPSVSPPAAKRSKRVVRKSKRGVDARACQEDAGMSYHGLLSFLTAYFGCLTDEQAIRYLYWANANLLLAVMLVQHDLYAEGEEALDPRSERTRVALEWAATSAGHPSPSTLLSRGCFLPLSDLRKIENYNDIFDPVALLAAQDQSLAGLRELASFVDPQFSVAARALETLCSAKCDIVNMLPSSTERLEKNFFHEAAMAARHPLPLQLGELHQLLLLMPGKRNTLLSLISEAQASGTVVPVQQMTSVLEAVLSRSKAPEPVLVQAPKLCAKASKKVSDKRSGYEANMSWYRPRIERVLKDYTLKNFWEPKYKLDIILGVEESNEGPKRSFGTCYRVNFTATSDLKLERTLFFAEFSCSSKPKPSFCCPLPYPCVARCYYGPHSARKIVYPDRSEDIGRDIDITKYGTKRVHCVLEMDLVYFSSKIDVQLAEYLNHAALSESEQCNDTGRGHPKKKSKPRPPSV